MAKAATATSVDPVLVAYWPELDNLELVAIRCWYGAKGAFDGSSPLLDEFHGLSGKVDAAADDRRELYSRFVADSEAVLEDYDDKPLPITNAWEIVSLCEVILEGLTAITAWPKHDEVFPSYQPEKLMRSVWRILQTILGGAGTTPAVESHRVSVDDAVDFFVRLKAEASKQITPRAKPPKASNQATGKLPQDVDPESYAIALLAEGKAVTEIAASVGVCVGTLYRWGRFRDYAKRAGVMKPRGAKARETDRRQGFRGSAGVDALVYDQPKDD